MVQGLEKRQRSAIAASSVWLMMMVSLPLLMLILLTPPSTTAFLLSNTGASHDGPHGDNHRVKRFAPPIFTAIEGDDDDDDDDCGLCLLTDDQESCQRCLALRLLVPRDYAADGQEENMAAAQKRGYEPMRRFQRGSGCSCCYFSRMTNTGCCAACSMTTKRYGKRSGSGAVTSDDAVMTSYRGSDYVVESVNCQCCALNGEAGCCRRCLAP